MSTNKSAVYTIKEKLLLAQLVAENEIVENKRTDATTLEQKNKAWDSISNAFNSQPEVSSPRTSSQLKKLWNNLKQRKRKQNTEEKYNMLLTGGGPPKKDKPDPVLELVEDAAPNLDITVDNPWDSTAVFEKELAEVRKCEEPPPKDIIVCTDSVGLMENEVRPSVSAPVNPVAHRVSATVLTEREARIKKINEAIEQQRELHNLRMKIVQEEGEFIIKKAKAEAELASLQLARYKCKMD